ncbi:MAG: imidazole glycerol phosphate synthase subunit HisH [bacterium]
MKYIAIIDYGMGNLRSIQKAFEFLSYQAVVTDKKQKIKDASAVVLPGVGAFPKAMEELRKRDLEETVKQGVQSGRPFLGICLGMQILFEESDEFGSSRGLGIVQGKVTRFSEKLKIPHMGWNEIELFKRPDFLKDFSEKAFMYFVHSYYCEPKDKKVILTKTFYGKSFVSSIAQDNLIACQFHPEKSQKAGLELLDSFGRLL